jgi:pimeloyl-ACP methyl ester carboxylesterase
VVGRKCAAIVFCLFLLPSSTAQVAAQTAAPVEARNVVFVHGAWADGSSWSEVIPLLQAAGLRVTSVQNPLTSLADAAAETRRALALQDGPTVLAGHSWSGTLVSEVGADPKVTALVYVAARAPDAGEDFVALSAKFPTAPARAGIEDHGGFTRLSEDAFLKYFCQWRCAREGASSLRRAAADCRLAVRRSNDGCGLAVEAKLLCSVEERRDDSA